MTIKSEIKPEKLSRLIEKSSAVVDVDKFSDTMSVKSSKRKEKEQPKKSALEEIIEDEERRKAKKSRRDNWLEHDIVVKVVSRKLGEKYYKQKGIVVDVLDKYTGVVEMLDSHDRLKLDQEHLETVIPQVGRLVKMLQGQYAGCKATLTEVDFDRFCCQVRLESGPARGRVLDKVKYEEISKLSTL